MTTPDTLADLERILSAGAELDRAVSACETRAYAQGIADIGNPFTALLSALTWANLQGRNQS